MNFNKLTLTTFACILLLFSCNKDDDSYIGTWTLSSVDVIKNTKVSNTASGEVVSDESIVGVGEDIDYTLTLSTGSFTSDGSMKLAITGMDLDGPITDEEEYSITDNTGTLTKIGNRLTFLPGATSFGLDPLLTLGLVYEYEVKNDQLILISSVDTDTPAFGITTKFNQDLEYIFDKQ